LTRTHWSLDAQHVEVQSLGGGQWVRVFRQSGVQEAAFAVPGPVVTIAGKGSLLAVVHHRGAPWHGTQQVCAARARARAPRLRAACVRAPRAGH
jgi:hypothetical protein